MTAHGDDCRPAGSIALVDVADGTTGGPHGQARHDTEPRNEGFHDIGPDLALGPSSTASGPRESGFPSRQGQPRSCRNRATAPTHHDECAVASPKSVNATLV